MRRISTPCLITLLIGVLLVVPFSATAFAQSLEEDREITAGKMAADVLIVRPLGIVATVVGSALFIIALPFAALGGNTEDVFEHLIKEPAKFTFQRPLGDI